MRRISLKEAAAACKLSDYTQAINTSKKFCCTYSLVTVPRKKINIVKVPPFASAYNSGHYYYFSMKLLALFYWRDVSNAPLFANIDTLIGPLHDPVTWCKITHAGEQVAQWDFQNKATRTSPP